MAKSNSFGWIYLAELYKYYQCGKDTFSGQAHTRTFLTYTRYFIKECGLGQWETFSVIGKSATYTFHREHKVLRKLKAILNYLPDFIRKPT